MLLMNSNVRKELKFACMYVIIGGMMKIRSCVMDAPLS